MARGYHRLSFRARHILRQFGKAKNITLQRLHLHELRHAISRKHHFKGPKDKPKMGRPGLYQRLSGKGRTLIRRLRHSRSWQVQKQTVNELEREVARGERIAVARAKRAERRSQRAGRLAKSARERGTRIRKAVQRAHEPHLARAERKQAARQAGPRKPRLPERARAWRARRAQRPGPARTIAGPSNRERLAAMQGRNREVVTAMTRRRAPSAPRTARAPRSRPARSRT